LEGAVIVTVTANPSVDRTVAVDRLVPGAVLRTGPPLVEAGGKGVNLARALAANGHPARAVLPSGGPDGERLVALLVAAGVDHVAVPVAGGVRSNVTVAAADGTTTKLNEPGPILTPAEAAALAAAVVAAARDAEWVVLCGSLPPGLRPDFYADLVVALRGTRVAVDSSGPALRAAVAARPHLVKPNREELAELTGRSVRTLGDALAAARSVVDGGVPGVLASVGAQGALYVTAAGAWHAAAPVRVPRSAVGAGDALLAGFLAGSADGAALAEGVAWGAAAAGLPGSRMPRPGELDRAAVRLSPSVDPDLLLTDH
jgi:1-phosphofructokinase